MDVHVGEEYLTKVRHLVMENDHSEADALFAEVLSSTILTFQTNRRIFRGMNRFSDHNRWWQVFDRVLQNSRFDLPSVAVATYRALSFEYVADYLVSRGESRTGTLDPTEELNLRLAKKVRRLTMAHGGVENPAHLLHGADEFFHFRRTP